MSGGRSSIFGGEVPRQLSADEREQILRVRDTLRACSREVRVAVAWMAVDAELAAARRGCPPEGSIRRAEYVREEAAAEHAFRSLVVLLRDLARTRGDL